MTTMILKIVILLIAALAIQGLPVEDAAKTLPKKKSLLNAAENQKISPVKETEKMPDLSEMVEIKEEDIPDGTWVLEVDEPIADKEVGESMDTASNVVFRPLFRYREKQSSRRIANNRRYRRRYYVPRRSYRQTGYYRPYRSTSYYYPYRYYGY